jgi:hypothetical protein
LLVGVGPVGDLELIGTARVRIDDPTTRATRR